MVRTRKFAGSGVEMDLLEVRCSATLPSLMVEVVDLPTVIDTNVVPEERTRTTGRSVDRNSQLETRSATPRAHVSRQLPGSVGISITDAPRTPDRPVG